VTKRILLVEPDAAKRETLSALVVGIADVDAHASFLSARVNLSLAPPDLLVTQLRLGPYNGLHLVHLSRSRMIRSVVYADSTDLVLVREVQSAGAFYETAQHLPVVLRHYVEQTLPAADRRSLEHPDRRSTLRGGRRVTDVAVMPA